jgi:hypothetical protein
VECYTSLSERVAELRSHEGARREASDAVKVAVSDLLHGVEVFTYDVTIKFESVVVDDGRSTGSRVET